MMVGALPSGRSAWRPAAIAGFFTALVVQAWFRAGQFISSGDISQFERRGLSRELFWSWNHQGTPDGGAAASAARWPEVFVARICDGAGLSGPNAQRVFLTLVAGLVGASIAWMLVPLVHRIAVLIGAGLVALANPLTLVTLPNHLSLVAMSAVAILGGVAVRMARGHPPRPVVLVWMTVLVGYLTVNPPLLAVTLAFTVMAFITAAVVAGRSALLAMAPRLGVAVALSLVASLIWLVPFIFTTLHPGELASFVAPVDVEQWSWTHIRSSLGNVINLTGHWPWQHPRYLPFVPELEAHPFRWLRWALPMSVVLAPMAQQDGNRRRLCLGILAATVPLIIIGKGLHPPFGGLNLWLYDHVPGLWLLREPLPKVSVVLVPLYVAAWALLFDALAARLPQSSWSDVRQRLAAAGAGALAVAPLLFGWPIFTGSVFASSGPEADRAAVPAEWDVATQRLQAVHVPGKVLQLPLVDYYQVGTTWGYYGADTLLSGRISAPVLQLLPGGYFASRSAFAEVLAVAERSLASGDLARFQEATERLGAGAVVVRSDFRLDPSRQQLVDPRVLRANLAQVPGASIIHDGALLQVAGLPQRGLFTQISTVRPSNDPSVLGGSGTASVDTVDSLLLKELSQGLVAVGPPTGATATVDQAGRYELQVADGTAFGYRTAVTPSGVELRPVSGIALDGRPLPLVPLDSFGNPDDIGLLGAGSQLVDPAKDGSELTVSSGSNVDTYRLTGPDVRMNVYRVQDCAKVDERTLDEVGIALQVEGGPEPIFTLRARDHRACSPIELAPPAGARAVRITYAEQVVSGASADPCLLEMLTNRCLPLTLEREVGKVQLTATLPDIPTQVTLFLYAERGGAVRYGVPTVRWFERASNHKVVAASPPVELEAGTHTVSVNNVGLLTVGQRSDVSNCGGTEAPINAGIRAVPGPDTLELSAERGSACVQFPISRLGRELRVIFDYRAEGGGTARFCLWWQGLNRCADAQPLSRNAGWTTADHTFTVPNGATGAGLFLYADGGPRGERRAVSYGRVQIIDATPLIATLIPADSPPPTSPGILESSVDRFGNYRLVVPPRPTATLLRFADGWSSRWEAKIRGQALPHLRVDGFANGWVLPASQRAMVVNVFYGPTKLQTVSLRLGFVILIAVTCGEIFIISREARRRRRLSERQWT